MQDRFLMAGLEFFAAANFDCANRRGALDRPCVGRFERRERLDSLFQAQFRSRDLETSKST